MDQIKYILVKTSHKSLYKNKIIDYYNRYFPEESNKIITQNTTIFWLAIKDDEIVGIVRMLTDYSRYALLLDLIVRKSERNHGIGKHLVKLTQKYCQQKQIKHLILTTDPRFDWLTSFYQKLGFKLVDDESLMEFNH